MVLCVRALVAWVALVAASFADAQQPGDRVVMRSNSIVPTWEEASPQRVAITLQVVENIWSEDVKQDVAMVRRIFADYPTLEAEATEQVQAYYTAAQRCLKSNESSASGRYSMRAYQNMMMKVTSCVQRIQVPVFTVPQPPTPVPTTMAPTPEPTTEAPTPAPAPIVMVDEPAMVTSAPVVMNESPPVSKLEVAAIAEMVMTPAPVVTEPPLVEGQPLNLVTQIPPPPRDEPALIAEMTTTVAPAEAMANDGTERPVIGPMEVVNPVEPMPAQVIVDVTAQPTEPVGELIVDPLYTDAPKPEPTQGAPTPNELMEPVKPVETEPTTVEPVQQEITRLYEPTQAVELEPITVAPFYPEPPVEPFVTEPMTTEPFSPDTPVEPEVTTVTPFYPEATVEPLLPESMTTEPLYVDTPVESDAPVVAPYQLGTPVEPEVTIATPYYPELPAEPLVTEPMKIEPFYPDAPVEPTPTAEPIPSFYSTTPSEPTTVAPVVEPISPPTEVGTTPTLAPVAPLTHVESDIAVALAVDTDSVLYELAPSKNEVPPFAVMDIDGSGFVTTHEWKYFVEELKAVAVNLAMRTHDQVDREVILRQVDFHYSTLDWCITQQLNKFQVESQEPAIFASTAKFMPSACRIRFRFSLLADLPPFTFFTKRSQTTSMAKIRAWMARQQFTIGDALGESIEDTQAHRDHLATMLKCASATFDKFTGEIVNHSNYDAFVATIEACGNGDPKM